MLNTINISNTVLQISISIFICTVLAVIIILLIKSKSKKEINTYKEKYNRAVSQRKSAEVRLGKIGENIAPFVHDWPYDSSNFRFIGSPVDGIQFNDDGIIMIEIKTGGSRLTKTQKKAKSLIKEGKFYFETFRINDKGCVLKREKK